MRPILKHAILLVVLGMGCSTTPPRESDEAESKNGVQAEKVAQETRIVVREMTKDERKAEVERLRAAQRQAEEDGRIPRILAAPAVNPPQKWWRRVIAALSPNVVGSPRYLFEPAQASNDLYRIEGPILAAVTLQWPGVTGTPIERRYVIVLDEQANPVLIRDPDLPWTSGIAWRRP